MEGRSQVVPLLHRIPSVRNKQQNRVPFRLTLQLFRLAESYARFNCSPSMSTYCRSIAMHWQLGIRRLEWKLNPHDDLFTLFFASLGRLSGRQPPKRPLYEVYFVQVGRLGIRRAVSENVTISSAPPSECATMSEQHCGVRNAEMSHRPTITGRHHSLVNGRRLQARHIIVCNSPPRSWRFDTRVQRCKLCK